jgi:glycosyltransferase involved in cell wall biosynthesis
VSRKFRHDICIYAPWVASRLAHGAETGGAETQVMLLSQALAQRGVDVCLLGSQPAGAEPPETADGLDVVVCETDGNAWPARAREATAVRRALREIDASVVVARSAGYWVGLLGLLAKLARRRFVFASASLGDFRYEQVLPKRAERLLFRLGVALADQIVVQTEEQIELCRQRFRKTPVLIKSVAEPAQATNRPREAFLWVGRAEPNKHPLAYLELARALPDAHFWMVVRPIGTTESQHLWDELTHAADQLPNLELLPPRPRPQLLELMDRAVAVVSTSGFEGMPNVFLEAWAHGTPVLSLNHDPDGIISHHHLGGFADGQQHQLRQLADNLWNSRHDHHQRAAHYQTYVQTHYSPETISAAWARALNLDD